MSLAERLRPEGEEELTALVRGASGPLRIVGGGTRPVGRTEGETLGTSALTGIRLYEPGALTLVAAAGTPLAEIEAALDAEGQRLAFEPMDYRPMLGTGGEPTLGGAIAANVSGPRRIQVGAARDFCLGVRFVDGTGAVVANGGRVMKNVTGYDLVKLMAGSRGTLGILTEIALKILPQPETAATLTLRGLPDREAIAALSAAVGSPFEVTGAAHDPQAGITRLRIEGFAASVRYRARRLSDLLVPFGSAEIIMDATESAEIWRNIRDVVAFADAEGDIWRISVKPTDGPEAAVRLGGRILYDWAGGLIWAALTPGTDARSALTGLKGHATLVRAAPGTRLPVFHPEPKAVARLSAGLRAKFDPRGILNPGLMG